MNRSWMKSNRLTGNHNNEVIKFIEFSERNLPENKGYFAVFEKYARIRKNLWKGRNIQLSML